MGEKSIHILLVEDQKTHAELVSRAFESQADKFHIKVAYNLKEAREYLSEATPNLVITDLLLPDGKGTEFLQTQEDLQFPVIVMTSHGDEEVAVEALKVGALDYVVKSEETLADMPRIAKRALREWDHINQRKQAEEALRESEERYRSLYEGAPVGYLRLDAEGRITNVNKKELEMFGYTKEEMVGRFMWDFVLEKEEARKMIKAKMSGNIPSSKGLESVYIRRDGTTFPVLIDDFLVKDKNGRIEGNRLINRDITDIKKVEKEKRKLEDQLQKSHKMEAIATLGGGIAHQFNNALSPISIMLDMLKMEYSDDEKIVNYAKQMKVSTHRMAELTNQLLAYARGGKYQAEIITINEFIDHTLPIIQTSINPDIRIEMDLTSEMLNIEMDQTQMQMVLSAILVNASEAMEDKGLIRISTREEDIDEAFLKYHSSLKLGRYVCIKVEDSGIGMDKDTRERIFEPFFTTKFEGRGLGMASAYGIVKNHNGWISIYSEAEKGTVVRIYLPLTEALMEKSIKTAVEPIKGTGTILIIEDDQLVMDISRALLERLGYNVLAAMTGEEAVDIAKTFDGGIDIAILDLILPDMQGGTIYPLIMKVRPALKVIICSGYAINGPAQKILDAGAQAFIQKPFTVATLTEKLKEVLDKK